MEKYVYAMSKSRSELGDYFEERTRPLIEHLVKLFLYPSHRSVKHWRREVANLLNSTDTLKGSHKLPSAEFILKNSYKVHEKFIHRYIEQIIYDYGEPDYDSAENYMDVKSAVKNYFVWVANKLSNSSIITYPEIYSYLENHGF